jgi:hypothetical protein
MFLAFYLPLRFEGYWRTAAIVNALAWLVCTAVVTRLLH